MALLGWESSTRSPVTLRHSAGLPLLCLSVRDTSVPLLVLQHQDLSVGQLLSSACLVSCWKAFVLLCALPHSPFHFG